LERFAQRRDRLRRLFRKSGTDGLLVTNFVNVTYLTGFTGDDSYLLIHPQGEVLLSDGRYTTQIAEECPALDMEIRRPGVGMLQITAKAIKATGISKLSIEADSMSVGVRDRLHEARPAVELVGS